MYRKPSSWCFIENRKKSVRSIVAIDNTVVKRVQSFNFLDIMLNEALSWKIHIPMVRNKISIVIGILYQLKYVFPENVLFTIYNSLIVSYINYGRLLWGVDCHKLETLQKKVLRFMTNNDNEFLLRRMKRKKNPVIHKINLQNKYEYIVKEITLIHKCRWHVTTLKQRVDCNIITR